MPIEQSQRVILFDIDKTLINTELLRDLQKTTLARTLGISLEELEPHYQRYYAQLEGDRTRFNPTEFLTFLAQQYQQSVQELKAAFFEPHNFQAALYGDVVETLSQLRNMGYKLGLYSQGERSYQEHKMLTNNLLQFFEKDRLYVGANKMDAAIMEDLPEGTIVLDDKDEVMAFLEKYPNVIPVHVVRDAENILGEFMISHLHGLFPILDSLGNARSSK